MEEMLQVLGVAFVMVLCGTVGYFTGLESVRYQCKQNLPIVYENRVYMCSLHNIPTTAP